MFYGKNIYIIYAAKISISISIYILSKILKKTSLHRTAMNNVLIRVIVNFGKRTKRYVRFFDIVRYSEVLRYSHLWTVYTTNSKKVVLFKIIEVETKMVDGIFVNVMHKCNEYNLDMNVQWLRHIFNFNVGFSYPQSISISVSIIYVLKGQPSLK